MYTVTQFKTGYMTPSPFSLLKVFDACFSLTVYVSIIILLTSALSSLAIMKSLKIDKDTRAPFCEFFIKVVLRVFIFFYTISYFPGVNGILFFSFGSFQRRYQLPVSGTVYEVMKEITFC